MSENNGIKLNLYFKSFTKLTHEEKLKVLELRNYDYVRKNMYNNSIISIEEHFNFINNLKNRSDCIYWAIFSNKNLIGAINLTDIKGNFAEWGFYIDNNCFGLGAVIEYFAMEHFIEAMGFEQILARVYEENKSVYNMHKNRFAYFEAPGYNIEIDNNKYNALILTKENWLKRKEKIYTLINKIYTLSEIRWDTSSKTLMGGGKMLP